MAAKEEPSLGRLADRWRVEDKRTKGELKRFNFMQRSLGDLSGVYPIRWVLNTIRQGSEFYERTGNTILMEKLHFKCGFFYNTSPVLDVGPIRVIVAYDYQTMGVAPETFDLLRDGGGYGNTFGEYELGDLMSGFNEEFRDRWIILIDELFVPALQPSLPIAGERIMFGPSERRQLGFERIVDLKGADGEPLVTQWQAQPPNDADGVIGNYAVVGGLYCWLLYNEDQTIGFRIQSDLYYRDK